MVQLFSVPVFFILFRETLEASIVLSVMFSIVDRLVQAPALKLKMHRQVFLGTLAGFSIALAFGIVIISLFYTIAKHLWDHTEALWEGIFSLIACILITVMALAMVRVDSWKRKWEKKLTKITTAQMGDGTEVENKRSKFTLFFIPFSVVLREGVEAVIFTGGVGVSQSGASIPIAVVTGAICGILVGYTLYRGAGWVAFKRFMFFATLLLIVIAAGLFSTSVHEFEEKTENEDFVWQLNCCDPEGANGWKLLSSVTGWNNEATVGTLTAYIMYWAFIVVAVPTVYIIGKRREEKEDAAVAVEEQKLENAKHNAECVDQRKDDKSPMEV